MKYRCQHTEKNSIIFKQLITCGKGRRPLDSRIHLDISGLHWHWFGKFWENLDSSVVMSREMSFLMSCFLSTSAIVAVTTFLLPLVSLSIMSGVISRFSSQLSSLLCPAWALAIQSRRRVFRMNLLIFSSYSCSFWLTLMNFPSVQSLYMHLETYTGN